MRDTVYRQDVYDVIRALDARKQPITPADMAYAFRNLPSADSVEVVRCHECEHWMTDGGYENYHYNPCAKAPINTHRDFFCRSGERRIKHD